MNGILCIQKNTDDQEELVSEYSFTEFHIDYLLGTISIISCDSVKLFDFEKIKEKIYSSGFIVINIVLPSKEKIKVC